MTPEQNMSGTAESAMSAMLLAAAAAASSLGGESSRLLEGARKRKATPSSSSSASPEVPETEPPSTAKILKMRKLKSYSVEEKLDIIDYAKIIGNRAAGREFNVAESSIREWRKNEEKIRQMAEVSPSKFRSDGKARRLDELDRKLIAYIETTDDVTWHDIGLKANDLWKDTVAQEDVDDEPEFNANMGWVSRFFKRNQNRVRTIAPPQSNPASTHPMNPEPVSMVQAAPLEMPTGKVADSFFSQTVNKRRKPLRPQKVERPTLRLSPQQISECEPAIAPSQEVSTKDDISEDLPTSKTQEENVDVAG
uniref:HTH CENPB-type domain-containing protein n=1 Tax=Steinernema glaseri TaxID=37863 RepID=A0A1I7YM14_9BILA